MTSRRSPHSACPRAPILACLAAGVILVVGCGGEGPEPGGPGTRDAAAERGAFSPDATGLDCAEVFHDFGAVWEDAVLEHEFLAEVRGPADLVIRATTTDCGCALPRLEVVGASGERTPYELHTPLAPGTRLAVLVRYDTRGKRGTLPRNVYLFCNIPGGMFTVTVGAEVRPWLLVDPDPVPTFTMTDIAAHEVRLAVTSAVGERFLLAHDRRAVPEPLTVALTPREPDATGRAVAWDVVVHLAAGMPRGPHAYPLHLVSDVPHPGAPPDERGVFPPHSAVPRLSVEVLGRFRVDPPRRILDFGVVTGEDVVSRTLRVTCLDPDHEFQEPRVELVPLREGEPFPLAETAHVTVRPVPDAAAWEVQVLFDGFAETVRPRVLARLILETGHPGEPQLEATISARIQRPAARTVGPLPTPSDR